MLNRFRNSIFVFIILFIVFGRAYSAADNLVLINDLRDDWLIFDSKHYAYVPFVGTSLESTPSLSFPLNMERYKHYKLFVLAPSGTSVFFNQQLIAYEGTGEGLLFDVDSLRENYASEMLLVTLYNPGFNDEGQVVTSIVRIQNQEYIHPTALADPAQLLRRSTSAFSDFFVFGIIILLTLYAIIVNAFNKKLLGFYNLGRAFSFNFREEATFKGKIFDSANLPILIVHSFLISFVAITVIMSMDTTKLAINNFRGALAHWALLALAVFVLFILKYWLLAMVGSLFKLPLVNRHYLEYIRLSKIFFAILFLLFVLLYMGFNFDIHQISPIILKVLVLFFILRVFILYFKFIRSSSFNNLYLFSYLCSTEVLPMVVGLKILLNK
jgi:hypothetical protein